MIAQFVPGYLATSLSVDFVRWTHEASTIHATSFPVSDIGALDFRQKMPRHPREEVYDAYIMDRFLARMSLALELPPFPIALNRRGSCNQFRTSSSLVFNPTAASSQSSIVDAAIETGVRHLITPDFSSDTFNEHAAELMIFEPKLKSQEYLERKAEEGKIAWTAIIPGPFYDWG